MLISFPLLCYSTARLFYSSIYLYPFFILWLFLIIYFGVSLRVNFFSKDFDVEKHKSIVARWKPSFYPTVDIFLPICGEPIKVLRNTWDGVIQVKNHYKGRVNVYCLDDGDSSEVDELAYEYDFQYHVRPNRGWFKKAGNLRYGFEHTRGDFIIIFDADFRPRFDFIDELMPYFYEDKNLGIVQSPQFFRIDSSQNWVERGAGVVQEFFYRAAQVSRQKFDAAICVGSNAIYKREALNTIGGTALFEHSEDVRTGFGIGQHGWKLKYIPINLATGLCPSDLGAFFRQQYRCGAGALSMITGRDFWHSKLKMKSRLCYFSSFLYYLHTALYSFLTPLLPLTLLLFLPKDVRIKVIGTFVEVLGLQFGCKDTIQPAVFGVPRSCLDVA